MQIEALIQNITEEVKHVQGIRAIVLGGSRARNTHRPSSDVDLGIYYHPDSPFDLGHLREVATLLDDDHRRDVITDIGGWGPWINGGGWLRIQSHPVDFLYRDLAKIKSIIDDCLEGNVEIVYQPGHPLGFVSSIYLAEVAVCQPLWDPDALVSQLKEKVIPYPESLRRTLIQKFAWEIDFSLEIARKGIEGADIAYAAGCCFRSVMCMLQVLFALNKAYWLNEKGALNLAETFAQKPGMLQARIQGALKLLEPNPPSIRKVIENLAGLSREIHGLIQGA